MHNKKPPFEVTEAMLSDVMKIGELVGKVSSTQNLSANPTLRRQNRIRTIYSSLAIEQNTLSLEQVTAVLSGKRVLAPLKDITEVQNAYEIYDHLDELDPYKVDDLLLAHRVMMRGLVQEAGAFRSRPVESIIHDHQQEYYDAINRSNAEGEGTVFVAFMLGVIREALEEVVSEQPGVPALSRADERWTQIEARLQTAPHIRNADVQAMFGVSPATAGRLLTGLVKEGRLVRVRDGRYWAYRKA